MRIKHVHIHIHNTHTTVLEVTGCTDSWTSRKRPLMTTYKQLASSPCEQVHVEQL